MTLPKTNIKTQLANVSNTTELYCLRILAIEESESEQKLIRSILDAPIYQIDSAKSAEEALEMVLHNNYNLVLVGSISFNGLYDKLALTISDLEERNELSIIFLRALENGDEFIQNGLNIDAVEFISKPLNEELLHLKVKNRYLEFKLESENRRKEEKIKKLKDEYREKSKGLLASINYAMLIQERILPSIAEIENTFDDIFVFYQPKDTIGGDFYFVKEVNNRLIVIAADCTGHGVPGAMLSMVGYEFVDHIINEMRIFDPADILKTLDKKMKSFFKNGSDRNLNCLDASVVVFRPESNILEYASARRPIYLQNGNEITELKGDRISIGEQQGEAHTFITKELAISENTWVYQGSDGFVDQFGGERNKKFGTQRFKELLIKMKDLSRAKSKKVRLIDEFYNWKSNRIQIDDVTVLGYLLKTTK